MPIGTETPAAPSTKPETKTSDLAAAAAAGQSRAATPPPAGAGAPPPGGAADAAAQKAAADKAAADAAAAAAAGKGPSWHPPADEKKPAEGSPEAKAAADKAAAEKKAADEAAAAAAKAGTPDPTKFEIKAPEGVKVEPALLEKYRTFAKDLGLSQEQMQKLYDRDSAAEKAAYEGAINQARLNDERAGTELVKKWGAQAVENDALAKRGWDVLDPTGAVRQGLKHVGLLNWEVATNAIVEFARKHLKEDSAAAPSVGRSVKEPASPEETFAQGYKDRAKKGAK